MNTESVLPILGELFAKSALITLAAVLLARAWRSATAAQRHLLWFVALATVMMLPFTRLVAPFWRIPVGQAKPATVVKMEPLSVPAVSGDLELPTENAAALAPKRAHLDWRKTLLGTWLSVAALLLGYRLFGSWRLHRLMWRSTPVDDPRIRLLLSRTLSELHLHRRPEIRLSEECRVPITWGSLRPVMLLPKGALQWSDTWVLAALRHEAAHISRYDYLTRWFAQVACALYWPNPLVWLLARSLRVAQELAADDLVLRSGTPADEYALQLVDAARAITAHGFFVRQAVAMACPSTLEDRVRAIVDGHRDRRPLSRLAAACGSLTLACALALSTAAQLRSDEQKPATATQDAEAKPVTPLGPQIEIEGKFVELASSESQLADLQPAPADQPAIFTDPQFQVIIRALNQKKGVDVLSSPRVTTRANLRAVVEVTREFRTPTEWKMEGGIWSPTQFETKNLGVTLEIEPHLTKDGAIEMHTISSVVDFLGFLDLDTGKTIPAGHYSIDRPAVPPVVPGHRSKGIYSERKKESTVIVKSGETFQVDDLPETADIKAFAKDRPQKRIMVFVSTRIITPAPAARNAAEVIPVVAGVSHVTVNGAGTLNISGGTLVLNEDGKAVGGTTLVSAGQLNIADGGSDTEFLRRAYLDITGRQPTPGELRAFLDDPRPWAEKRKAVIDKLTAAKNGASVKPAPAQASDAKAALYTREWKIPTNLIPMKPDGSGPESVREWLTSRGIVFEEGASATVSQPGRLIVRDAQAQLDLIDQLVSQVRSETRPAAVPNAAADVGPAATENPVLAKARRIIIPKVELRDATFTEGLEFLRKQAVEFDPQKTGVKINIQPGALSDRDPRITISLANIPLIEALQYLTALCNLEFTATPDAILVQRARAKAPGAGAAAPAPSVAPAESPTLAKAAKIIIPKLEMREATLAEAIDFLRAKAKELDPDKTGINIVVKPGADANVHLTLSLSNIPLSEALRYVASLAGLQIKFEQDAVVLGPPASASAAQPEVKTTAAPEPEKPVEITADKTRMENGVAIAEGHARLAFGKYDVGADTIRYHPDTRAADLIGHAEVKDGANVIVGGEIGITFSSGSIRVPGSHR